MVFNSVVPTARLNPSLPLPIDNSFQGSDISRTQQIKERASTMGRSHLGYNLSLSVMEIERPPHTMENTAHDVGVLSMPTGGAQARPQSPNPSDTALAKEVEKVKKQRLLFRALKGSKGPGNELAVVEEMLGNLLVEVKALQIDLQQIERTL